jgi:heme exporter protein CcmD
MDWNAPHLGFVIISYLLSFVALGGMIWTSIRLAKKRNAELDRLERDVKQRKHH